MGGRLLFVGRGREVVRLSGVNVNRMRTGALVASSTMAAFAGILYTGMRGTADPSSAPAFLLPAFAAAVLGSTSLHPGRFHAPGALVAVFFLFSGIILTFIPGSLGAFIYLLVCGVIWLVFFYLFKDKSIFKKSKPDKEEDKKED